MSTPIRIKADSIRLVSNPEALAYLKMYEDELRETVGTISPTVSRVIEYLSKFSKIRVDKAPELREILESKGFKPETIVMIMNICPKTLDELRPLLELENKVYETSFLEEVLGLLGNYCENTEQ